MPHLSKRYLHSKFHGKVTLDNTATLGDYCISLFVGKKYEAFYIICLNSQYELLGSEMLNYGTINSVPVYPRRVIETAFKYNAAKIVIAHNHPSGSTTASREDVIMTEDLTKALAYVDIEVVDHVIASGEDYFSFRKAGLMR